MDITELKDKTVVELAQKVGKPKSPRSKKPTEYWEPGARFRVRRWQDRYDTNPDDVNWELQEVRARRWSSGVTYALHGDTEMFLRLVRHARPVDDVGALLVLCNQSAEAILEHLIANDSITLDHVKVAVAALNRADELHDQALADRQAAAAAKETPQ